MLVKYRHHWQSVKLLRLKEERINLHMPILLAINI